MAVQEIRARDADDTRSARPPGTVVVVAGGRAGVGKTSVAVGLAFALAAREARVALIDLDLRLGNIKALLGLRSGGDVLSAVAPDVLDDLGRLRAQLAWTSSGVDVLVAPPPDARGSIDPIRVERMFRQLTLLYDYVIVDTAPGGDGVTAAAIDVAGRVLFVTTPESATASVDVALPRDRTEVVLNRAPARTRGRSEAIVLPPGLTIAWRLGQDTLHADVDEMAGRLLGAAPTPVEPGTRERFDGRARSVAAAIRARRPGRRGVAAAAAVLLAVVGIRAATQTVAVADAAMSPAIEPGQQVLVSRVSQLIGDPARGDVVALRDRVADQSYLKRVVGLPGDTVLLEDGQQIVVPAGLYLVLGDNRLSSFESHAGWLAPREDVAGRAVLTYWPPAHWGAIPGPAADSRVRLTQPTPVPTATAAPATSTAVPPTQVAATATRSPATATAAVPTPTAVAPTATVAAPTPTSVPPTPTVRPPTFRNVLEERFVDNRRGWSSDPRANAWVADGVYHVVARQPGRFVAVRAPLAASLRDGAVTATFRKTGGPAGGGYGLIVRDAGAGAGDGRDQSGRYYVLEASDRGEVGVWRRDGDRWVDLKPWTASPTVRRNAEPNMLSVRAIGQRLVFLVNGAEAAAIEDAALGAGSVGLFVGGDLNEVQVERFVVEEME